ncbi:Smr/MutS family protein [bacterium]|nr:Smr/MutS family protein [bacterium]
MDEHSLRVLELIPVLALVAGQTHGPLAREYVEQLRPVEHFEELQSRQAEVGEALLLLDLGFNPPLVGLEDKRSDISLAERGGTLDPVRLLAIREIAVASRKLGRYLEERQLRAPRLADRARWMPAFPRLESEISRCLSPDGRVLDAASTSLRNIRAEIRSVDASLQRNLQALLRDPDIQKMVQEPIVTQRQGRQVIPVKSEHKGKFPGLVIDQSGSGATVFMEPLSVLPLSNQLRSLISAEEHEIESILRSLSGWVASEAIALTAATEELAIVDAVFAQAAYAKKVDGSLPKICEGGRLKLCSARHPLLLAKGVRAVPISLEMGPPDFTTVVVTGPNTGGKTVALKTVGMLAAMAMSGLPIPAEPDSQLPFLSEIWADIGDEQSISQSLSTFSAHLTQILRILPRAGPGSLVLLDELGAGTDPSEGAALGVSLLEHLNEAGALTLVTTHLSDLKIYASKTPGFENAAVEFDAATLSPTYRLTVGVPGRSNALLIASGLGLPDPVLRRAREILGKEHVGVEVLLDDLESERQSLRQREIQLSQRLSEMERDRQLLAQQLENLQRERRDKLDQAAQEAEEVLRQARDKSHGLLRDFRQRIADLGRQKEEALAEAQRYLADLRDQGEEAVPPEELTLEELSEAQLERLTRPDHEEEHEPREAVSEAPLAPERHDAVDAQARVVARTMEARLTEMAQDLQEMRSTPKPTGPLPQVEAGQRVYSRRYGQEGEVLQVRGDKAEVRLGMVRLSLSLDDLDVLAGPAKGENIQLPDVQLGPLSQRVDLRGMTVDEAVFELGKAIDQAALVKSEKVEVIHGKGTGALRHGVQKFLKSHPLVEDQKLGEVYEGGWGVTVVKLRR